MNSSLLRPSLRAALVVSGLTVAVGCGSATTPVPNNAQSNAGAVPRPTNSNQPTTDGTPTELGPADDQARAPEHCEGFWRDYSEECCARESDATWSAERGCEPTVMVGPFVPPEMNA